MVRIVPEVAYGSFPNCGKGDVYSLHTKVGDTKLLFLRGYIQGPSPRQGKGG